MKSRIFLALLAIAGSVLVTAGRASAQARRCYVTVTGAGTQDGLSWENASPSLQQTIDACQPGDSVWVACGTYQGGFVMREGVTVIGGFRGDEQTLAERAIALTPVSLTTLSGGGIHRVLRQEKPFAAETVWDGFRLTDGVAQRGAGVLLQAGGELRFCLIEGNRAGQYAVGEYVPEAGGIVFYPHSGKVCILSLEAVGRYYQADRARQVLQGYELRGHSDWRLPTAVELRSLVPTADANYLALCQAELTLAEQGGQPLAGQRCWTSTAATANGMKAAGCCDFAGLQYYTMNTYQYSRVRPVRECAAPSAAAASGAGVYALGGCLTGCIVSGNAGAQDIEAAGQLVIRDATPDAIAAPADAAPLHLVWKAGQHVPQSAAARYALYDAAGRLLGQGTGSLTAPHQPGLYLLSTHDGQTAATSRVTVVP